MIYFYLISTRHSNNGMDKLPLELGEFIFQYVGSHYQMRMAKGGIGGFIEAVLALRLEFTIWNVLNESDDMDVFVNAFPLVQKLYFCDDYPCPSQFKAIGRMKNLRKLEIECERIRNDDVAHICQGLSRHLLEDLNLTNVHSADPGLDSLQYLTNLRKFAIHCYGTPMGPVVYALCTGGSFYKLECLILCDINDEDCKAISGLPMLRKLNINSDYVTDEGITAMCSITKLESLELSNLDNVSSEGLLQISLLRGLKTLALDETEFDNNCLLAVSRNCSVLENLNMVSNRVTNPGWYNALRFLSNLKTLIVHYSDIDDKVLWGICKLVFLEKLNISGCTNITPEAFSMIVSLQNLKILTVDYTKINNKSLSAIVRMPTLRRVGTHCCHTDNKILKSHAFTYKRKYLQWIRHL